MSEVLQDQEIIRLYEYEPYKPELEDYIEHHGVKDMHWGVRNGPPYPLSSKLSTGSRLKKGAKGAGGSYGGNPDRLKKKAAKASVKAAKANKKAAQAGNSLLHPFKAKKKDKLQTKAFKAQAKADKMNAKLDKEELKDATKKKIQEQKAAVTAKGKEATKEFLKETYLFDNFDGYLDSEKPPKAEDFLSDWGLKSLTNQAKAYMEREHGVDPKSINEKDIKDALIEAYNETYRSKDTKYGGKEASKELKKASGKDFDGETATKYEKELANQFLSRQNKDTKYGGAMKEVAMQKAEKLQEKYKKLSYDDAMKVVTGQKKLDDVVKKTFSEKRRDKKEQQQRTQSLEKARQTKAENTAKKKAEAEEREKISEMREKAIKNADIVTMYKNATHFSNEEIQAALDRKGTLDRLASEVSKSAPKTTETPKKQGYVKTMVKEKTKEGLKSGAEAVVKNVATQALKMTLEQLALSASGTATNDQWDNKKKLEERRKNVLRLIKA